MHRLRRAVAFAALALVGTTFVGCAAEDAVPPPTPSPTSSAVDGGEEEPTFHADGSAEDNLPLFAAVTGNVWKSANKSEGRAYIDALQKAGFDREDMQVTEDRTTVDREVESLQFSVAWGKNSCLVGQVGPSTGDPVTMVMDQLDDGVCLLGETREIDW